MSASSNSAEEADGLDFDSDAEADVAVQPPDELYDEQADDKDEAWATVVRQGRQSAAILSCPCCLETLCLDCQQHELYHNQFRAMFVRNCKVDDAVALRAQSAAIPQGDVYQPVRCATSNTQVGVQDSDEVYHFVHVVASNA